MTAQTLGERNHSPGTSPPDLSFAVFWCLLSLLSVASPQVELTFASCFPDRQFCYMWVLTRQVSNIWFMSCLLSWEVLIFCFFCSSPWQSILSSFSNRKSKQTELYPVKAMSIMLKFSAVQSPCIRNEKQGTSPKFPPLKTKLQQGVGPCSHPILTWYWDRARVCTWPRSMAAVLGLLFRI